MALRNNDIPQDDEISKLLDKMYEQLMMSRIELMDARKNKAEDIQERLEAIDTLNDDFNEMLKNHTSYWKYKKATGQTSNSHSEKLIQAISKITSNMGTIVSTIPSK